MKDHQKMFPEYMAASNRDHNETHYRPSNGCEGDSFMQRWCNRCAKRDDEYAYMGCDISVRAMLYYADEPEYPPEWTYEDGQPCCTAFEEREAQR